MTPSDPQRGGRPASGSGPPAPLAFPHLLGQRGAYAFTLRKRSLGTTARPADRLDPRTDHDTDRNGLLLDRHEAGLLADWLRAQEKSPAARPDLIKEGELREQCRQFISLFRRAIRLDTDTDGPAWQDVRDLLASVSRSRGLLGLSPSATATFVFSFKEPLFELLRREASADPRGLAELTWTVSTLLDRLGLFVTKVYQQARDAVIERQQQEILELSTPVVKLWEGVLALPIIGTLDSARTQTVMENLLQRIVDTGCEKGMVSLNGTLGHEARKVQAFEYDWPAGATLVMHSDGLATSWDTGRYPGLAVRHPALLAGVLYRDFRRGKDDVTVVTFRDAAGA